MTDDETSRPEREEFKEILHNEVRRIDAIVAEFLEFARPKEMKLDRLNLTNTISASLRQIEAQANRVGLTIERTLEEDVFVRGDQEKLHQMTLNLLLNAIQASTQGHKINVILERRNGREALLIVMDTGKGIDESDLEHIFEPFFTTKSAGTGLGLAVVKDIVDRHSGEISIQSEKDGVTRAVVSFPLYVG